MVDYGVYNKDGVFLFTATCAEIDIESQFSNPMGSVFVGKVNLATDYMLNGHKRQYTEAELQAKNSMPFGWIWKMPERVAMDPRDAEKQLEDERMLVSQARAKAYPPLTDFADAMYWQTRGDGSKMKEYLMQCEAVKLAHPKP